MSTAFQRLLALYPADMRAMYEREMVCDFTVKLANARNRGWLATIQFLSRELSWLLCDALAERASTLYSHPSFRGRRLPNPGQVRPPNMSKKEWYG
jgi:hypothetical protein